jgi:hypothetical protein
VRQSAFQTAAASQHTLFAMIYSGACYRSYFSQDPRQARLVQLETKQHALQSLRTAIEQPVDGEVPESVLMTIALLAIHGSMDPRDRPRFTAPLYRDNEFYSTVKFDPTHIRALRALVRQRGGLSKLQLHGLCNLLSMIDTFHSLMSLSKPQFDPLFSAKSLCAELQASWDSVAWNRFSLKHDGFAFLDEFPSGPLLKQISYHVKVVLETYALSLRAPRRSPDMLLAVHMRRALQYDALCIDTGNECLFEAARLACIIYISELGWVLPVIGGFQATASKLLFQALRKCVLLETTHPDFFLWATVVGGICSGQTQLNRDFAALVRRSSTPLTPDSWMHVKATSQNLLPFEYEFTSLGHAFWDLACDLNISESNE